MSKTDFTQVHDGCTNYTMQSEDDTFYVSYATFPWDSDEGKDETALRADGIFYLLNGDWRKEYKELIPLGKQACLDFYNSKKDEHRSSWSED